ncbi:MAG: amidohydrolase [Acidobacteria bacterium]|nr:amidohydrolase [Acidobacteriota bacterium]
MDEHLEPETQNLFISGVLMPSPLDLAQAILPELVEIRRDLHQHPEVSWEEERTGAKVADYCARLDLHVERVARTGLIAVLNPEKPGPAVALRADMDALPIQEENDLPYRSTVPGKGHLCGHDAHTAMLLGAARLLVLQKERIPFPVRFYFQPAEEVIDGGAALLMREKRLAGVAAIYGLHVNPLLPVGCLGLRSGPLMASMDRVEILVSGAGGHGAMPHLTHDPVLTSAEIIMALQSIVARRVDPLDSAVVSICQIEAGSAFNAIPSSVRLVGTTRSLSQTVWTQLPELIREIASGVAKAHGQQATVNYTRGTPVLVNPPAQVEEVSRAFRALGGVVTETDPMMGGEDFAFYLRETAGCFAFLGAGGEGLAAPHIFHSPHFNIDERALAWGAALFVQVVVEQAELRRERTGTNG